MEGIINLAFALIAIGLVAYLAYMIFSNYHIMSKRSYLEELNFLSTLQDVEMLIENLKKIVSLRKNDTLNSNDSNYTKIAKLEGYIAELTDIVAEGRKNYTNERIRYSLHDRLIPIIYSNLN